MDACRRTATCLSVRQINATIGVVDDPVIAPDRSVCDPIIGAGGFGGMYRHDVATRVPMGLTTRTGVPFARFAIKGGVRVAEVGIRARLRSGFRCEAT